MRVLDIVKKDLKVLFSDKKALSILILMPIILTTILSFALSGSFGDMGNMGTLNIAVVKNYEKDLQMEKFKTKMIQQMIQSQTDKSQTDTSGVNNMQELLVEIDSFDPEKVFFDNFLALEEVKSLLNYEVMDEDEARRSLQAKDISAVVILNEDYIYNMLINMYSTYRNNIEINVVGHADMEYSKSIVEDMINGFADIMSTIMINKSVTLETVMEYSELPDIGAIMKDITIDSQKMVENINADINMKTIEGLKHIDSFSYYSVAMASMFILFAAGYGARWLLEEKENITLARMSAAGVSKWLILFGKTTAIFLTSTIQMIALILFSSLLLGADWGSIPVVIGIIASAAIGVAGLGILLAVVVYKAGNYSVAEMFTSVIIQFMALLGGSYLPLFILPKFIGMLSHGVINGVALKAFMRNMQGYDFSKIVHLIITNVGIGLVLFIIALILFAKEGYYGRNTKVEAA